MPSVSVNTSKLKNQEVMKPSEKSVAFNKYIVPLLTVKKEKIKSPDLKVLFELHKQLFTGDELSIKDNYAALLAYFVLYGRQLKYCDFTGCYESARSDSEVNHEICSALPYGAVIASGIIHKWKPEQINQIIRKMLKLCLLEPEAESLVFYFLNNLVENLKSMNISKLDKITINSLSQMCFMLLADLKRDTSDSPLIHSANIEDLVDIVLQDHKNEGLQKKAFTLLAKKLLSFSDDIISMFWDKVISSYSNPRMDYKDMAVSQLLAAILKNYGESKFPIKNFFKPAIIATLSKSNPKIESVSKMINSSLNDLSKKISNEDKLILVESIIINSEKYLHKSPVVKLCDTLTLGMNFEGISAVVEIYKQVIMGKKNKAKFSIKQINNDFNEIEKLHAIRCLGKLMGHFSCKNEVEWRKEQLKFLFKIGFLTEYKNIFPPYNACAIRNIFYSSLDLKFSKLSDFEYVLRKLIKFASEKMMDPETNFVVPIKANATQLWVQTRKVIKSMDDEKEDHLIFKILLEYMALLMFSNYQVAKDSLGELFQVIDNKEMNSEEFHWMEVTTDLFLQLLSDDTKSYTKIINIAFGHICKNMTSNCLDLILSVVKGEVADQDETNDNESDEDESGDSDSDDDISDESDEESDEDSIMEDDGQVDKLRDALRQELYQVDTASTCGSVDLDNLDDEEGTQLNNSLGVIFKGLNSNIPMMSKNKAESLELHFRIRALGLLEIYLDNKPSLESSTIILNTLISLLKASIPDHTLAPLCVSLKKCLKKLSTVKEFSNCDNVTEKDLCILINHILKKDCSTMVYHDITEQIIDLSLFLIKAASQLSGSTKETDELIKTILINFFNETDDIPFHLFVTIFTSLNLSKLVKLASEVATFAFSNEIKPHKRVQALQLLVTFYNNKRLFQNTDSFEKSLNKIKKKILNNCLQMVSNRSQMEEMTKKFGCMFLDLITLLESKDKNTSKESDSSWNDMPQIIDQLSEIDLFKNELNVSFLKFCEIFNHKLSLDNLKSSSNVPSPEIKKKKRKSSEMKGHSPQNAHKKKKKLIS